MVLVECFPAVLSNRSRFTKSILPLHEQNMPFWSVLGIFNAVKDPYLPFFLQIICIIIAISEIDLTIIYQIPPFKYDIFYKYPPTSIYYRPSSLPISGELLTPCLFYPSQQLETGE